MLIRNSIQGLTGLTDASLRSAIAINAPALCCGHSKRLEQSLDVGWLGYGRARAGRADDARRQLAELDERGSRGELVPRLARLQIDTGLGDIAAIRTAFAAAIEAGASPLPIRFAANLQPFRTDPEIDQLCVESFGS